MIRVAFVGAPDSGKTTLAKVVSAELNLVGYIPAYIHEYARDYITKHGVRPYTVADQFMVFCRQLERENDMCSASTKIMYTDSPIMLPYIYAIDLVMNDKDKDDLVYLYNRTLTALKNRYDLIFLLHAFRTTLKDDVRAQDWDRISKLDTQIKAFFDLHGLAYTELNQPMQERVLVTKEAILRKCS